MNASRPIDDGIGRHGPFEFSETIPYPSTIRERTRRLVPVGVLSTLWSGNRERLVQRNIEAARQNARGLSDAYRLHRLADRGLVPREVDTRTRLGKTDERRVVGRRPTIDELRRRPEQRRERSGRDEGLDQRPSGRDGR